MTPGSFFTIGLGEQEIIQDPDDFCLQFDQSSSAESYLIGVQSATQVASSRTAVLVASETAPGASPAPPMMATRTFNRRSSQIAAPSNAQKQLLARHRVGEAMYLQKQLDLLGSLGPAIPRSEGSRVVPPTAQVGDTFDIRIANGDPPSCSAYEEFQAVVRDVGTHAIWLEDVDNPAGGHTLNDFQTISDQFDATIFDTDTSYFGAVTDNDANDRVVFVLSKEVNLMNGPAAFVAPIDFLSRGDCAASNEGEYVYQWVPDPNGDLGYTLTTEWATEMAPLLAAHELAHVIQVGRRVQAGSPIPTLWELEGQASFAEEIAGHAVLGNAVGQNLNDETALNIGQEYGEYWYRDGFEHLFSYFGLEYLEGGTAVGKRSDAPEDCTWLGQEPDHVCTYYLYNGVTWSLLRWISDHYGASFAGGEQELHKALIDNDLTGFENLADVVGMSVDTMLAQWAATLYLDDRGIPTDTLLTMPSWDLNDIVFDTYFGGETPHRLSPREYGFQAFESNVNVRGGSTAYYIVEGSSRSGLAIRFRGASDQALPSHMQVWVVRMQ